MRRQPPKRQPPRRVQLRAVRVPAAPRDEEKEEHYLTHIPFRAWCSYCTRATAPDDPRRRLGGSVAPLKPIVSVDYTGVADPPVDTTEDLARAPGVHPEHASPWPV